MPKKPKYVREYKDRHGITRLEFRRKGHKGWPLRQPLRSGEFWEDYRAAIDGRVPSGCAAKSSGFRIETITSSTTSFGWLIIRYKSSAKFKILADSTKRVRTRILDKLCEEFGDFPYAQLHTKAVMEIRDKYADVPETANAYVKTIRVVYDFALDYKIKGLSQNPALGVKSIRSKNPDGFRAWTADEVTLYESFHPVGSKARLAIALMLFGGCARRSDVIKLGKQHLTKDGRLCYRQFKGRTKKPIEIDIPIIDELGRVLENSPCGDLTFLVTEFGKPFTSNGFGNWFKKRCVEAGLPLCSAHGVRKAAAARLAELGCTDHEIMAIGGWTTLKEVQRYTKGARRRVLSDNAMTRVQEDIEGTKVSNFEVEPPKVRQKGEN